jgi:RHS repeat-associated protein
MARWYASREGRFMSPDPGHVGADVRRPQSWNAYLYVENDPIQYVDPEGLELEFSFRFGDVRAAAGW